MQDKLDRSQGGMQATPPPQSHLYERCAEALRLEEHKDRAANTQETTARHLTKSRRKERR